MICFPDFDNGMNPDEIGIDYVRNLVPAYDREGDDEGLSDEIGLALIMNSPELLEATLTNWFLGDHAFEELHPSVDNNFIVEAFNATTENCEVLVNWMNNIVEASDWHYDSVADHLNEERFHDTRIAIVQAWQTCHPNHAEEMQTPNTEMNADWLIHHLHLD